MEQLITWLSGQIPVIFVMGVVIYGLYMQVKAKELKIEEQHKDLITMTEKVTELSVLWTTKSADIAQKSSEFHETLIDKIDDLREIMKDIRNNGK